MVDTTASTTAGVGGIPVIDDEEKEIEQKMIKVISKMPKEVQNRFKALKVLSDRRSRLNDEFEQEIKKLEAKFAEKKKPLYEQRRQIIQGELKEFTNFTPTFDETLKKLEKECAEYQAAKKTTEKPEDKEEDKPIEVDHLKGKDGIPDFWFRAIKNNQMIWELVREKDEEILTHLKHIETQRGEDPKNLTVKFLFNENEFFEDKELVLTVVYKGDQDDTVSKIEATQIKWKEGKDPTKKKVKKKQKHKKTNETRTIVKTVEADSFFNVFTNRVAPEEGAAGDSEEENTIHDKIDEAMNLAEDVDDVLIPDALEYYLGLNEDFMGAGDEDDDDDEDDEDNDSDDDKPARKSSQEEGGKKKGGKKGGDKKEGGAAG